MRKERFKITPAAYLVLEKDEKILLLRRFHTGYEDGNYSLVAGHLEEHETFRQTVAREAQEEAGIKINPEDLEVVHVMQRYVVFNDVGARERLSVFIKAKKWKGEVKNMEPHKCDDLSWFPIDGLPDNTIPYIKQAIEHIRNKVFYSELGF